MKENLLSLTRCLLLYLETLKKKKGIYGLYRNLKIS